MLGTKCLMCFLLLIHQNFGDVRKPYNDPFYKTAYTIYDTHNIHRDKKWTYSPTYVFPEQYMDTHKAGWSRPAAKHRPHRFIRAGRPSIDADYYFGKSMERSGADRDNEYGESYEDRPVLRHHIAHFCPNLDVARECIRTCMKKGKPAFCGKDHICYCGHKYADSRNEDKGMNLTEMYSQFQDLYEKYFGPKNDETTTEAKESSEEIYSYDNKKSQKYDKRKPKEHKQSPSSDDATLSSNEDYTDDDEAEPDGEEAHDADDEEAQPEPDEENQPEGEEENNEGEEEPPESGEEHHGADGDTPEGGEAENEGEK